MKITILGPAHPYRGGLASIMEMLARTFQRRGHEVDIRTFTLQYPALLFPGKSQTVATPPPEDLRIRRCVNTMNPLNWLQVGRALRRERPDFLLLKYWTPFMAPCFGTIARVARGNGHTKVLCQIDNVEPHEHHLTDRPFNRYFLRSVDGFIYMSEQVHRELQAYSSAPALFSPHPLFENFGTRCPRGEACARLGLDPSLHYALFFGLIRDYKGLDLLLDAWAQLKRQGRTAGRRLIVAGEFYTSKEPYLRQIAAAGLGDEVLLPAPYWLTYPEVVKVCGGKSVFIEGHKENHFKISGLAEIVPHDRVGYVCAPEAEAIADSIDRLFDPETLARFSRNCVEERRRFSWEAMCDRLTELYDRVAR